MFMQKFSVVSLLSLSTLAASAVACEFTLWKSYEPLCFGPPGVYTIEPSQGKGLGVFATHDLQIGDIVMEETPVLKIKPPGFVKESGYPMSKIAELLRQEFDTLSPEEQGQILSLTYHATAVEKQTMDPLALIFRTNAYNSGNEIGLFPKIARINHSCRPNTSYYWSERQNKRIVYASREIKAGEEFSVTYIPLLLTQEERQKLLNRYGFKCGCEACAQEAAIRNVSDSRRLTIHKAFKDFEPQLTLTPPKSKSATRQARNNARSSIELAELVQEEGLADYLAKAYRIAAISHARVEDWEPAAIWANKGYEIKVMEDPQSVHSVEMYQLTSTFIGNWERELIRTKNQSSSRTGQ